MHSEIKELSAQRDEFDADLRPWLEELRRAARRLTGSDADASDLLQQASLRAWDHWSQFENGTNRRAWMHRIVWTTFINEFRRHRREREVIGALHAEARTQTPPDHRDYISDEVLEALLGLDVSYREVIVRVDVFEESYQEVADALACPTGTVMSRLFRARKLLRESLARYAVTEGYSRAA